MEYRGVIKVEIEETLRRRRVSEGLRRTALGTGMWRITVRN